MKFTIALNNSGGELDSKTIEIADSHSDIDEAVNLAASEVVEGWILSIGDTITIREA